MRGVKALTLGMLGAVAFGAAAFAADMPGGWSPPPAPRYTELLSGWYLRGDVGYRWNHVNGVDSGVATTSHHIDNAVGATIGAGFKYQWFRSDITLDYGSASRFTATTGAAVLQPQYRSTVDNVTGLLNGYIDFGTWWGITPYVGAGAGATYVRSQHYVDTLQVVDGSATSYGKTNFAWAWMAGVAIQVRPQWLVDVGFRHLDYGGVLSTAGTGAPNDFMTIGKQSTDEVRIGLRYLFD